MALHFSVYQPGRRVRVIQQMPQRLGSWTNSVEGVITRFRQAKTGAWFAHAKDDKFWLDRLELRLDDGEIVILNLDQYSVIEDLTPPAPPPDSEEDFEVTGGDEAATGESASSDVAAELKSAQIEADQPGSSGGG